MLQIGAYFAPTIQPAVTTPSLAASSALLGTSNTVDQGGGWLYHLLVKLGVSPDTATTVTESPTLY